MKVIILGGGPAGCSAAWYFKQKGVNDITIVEKEGENIGGCSRTQFYNSIPYEYGPQILYTDEMDIQLLFEKWLKNHKPPTADGEYHPKLSVDGQINNMHDFPITVSNVLKLKDPVKVIYELYQLNLEKPDFSNFEEYMKSRIGETLYNIYVRNYNIKQWKMDPSDMDADWARERTLTLREKNDMFQGRWQGHPGDYTALWEGLAKDCTIIKGEGSVSEDMQKAFIDGKEVKADLVVSTLPLGKDFEYVHSHKVFVGIKNKNFIMPSYANSFPNNYGFTRILDYKQQFFVDSDYSLLDFAYTWNGTNKISEKECLDEVKSFVRNVLKMNIEDIWAERRKYTYPVHNKKSSKMLDEKLKLTMDSNIVPMGRCGVHAYVSKDITFRMARIVTENLDDVIKGGESKIKVLNKLREKLR